MRHSSIREAQRLNSAASNCTGLGSGLVFVSCNDWLGNFAVEIMGLDVGMSLV